MVTTLRHGNWYCVSAEYWLNSWILRSSMWKLTPVPLLVARPCELFSGGSRPLGYRSPSVWLRFEAGVRKLLIDAL